MRREGIAASVVGVVLACLVVKATGGQATNQVAKASARLEVETKKDCFVVRFFVKNEGDKDFDVVIGHGREGKTVVPTFTLTRGTDTLWITPPLFRRPPFRHMNPDTQRIPAGSEVLYEAFTMGFPPTARGEGFPPAKAATMRGEVEFMLRGEVPGRLQLRTKPVPFP